MNEQSNATEKRKICGIYKITSPTGRIYIGQSVNIAERWKTYGRNKCKQQIKLYRSFKKYGVNHHKFEIIEECEREQLNERELFWGHFFKVLDRKNLNSILGNSKKELSDDVKEKISKSLKGRPTGRKISKEHREKINIGIKKGRSEEWKRKARERNLGKKMSLEAIEKIRISSTGRKLSKEAKEKISKSKLGKPHPHEKKKLRKPIIQYDLKGNFIKRWEGITIAAKTLNISKSAILFNLKGKYTQSAGYIWTYEKNTKE